MLRVKIATVIRSASTVRDNMKIARVIRSVSLVRVKCDESCDYTVCLHGTCQI